MRWFLLILSMLSFPGWSQTGESPLSRVITLDEFLGYVKEFHPFVRQADLDISQAQAGIMAARGGFDPKIEVDYETKQFKSADYYSILNSSFKIPTWYGVELKAGFDRTEGEYLNPQNFYPENGLATLGIAVPIGQGLFINQRMADLRKAKLFRDLSQAERDLEVAEILYQAILAYLNWYRSQAEMDLYNTFLENAEERLEGTRKLIREGDRPQIDSVEAGITVKNRKLGQEQARLKLIRARLELSNFLWIDDIPMELQDNMIPETNLEDSIEETLRTNGLLMESIDFDNHPRIKALQTTVDILTVEERLKREFLKPRIDLNYNYLSENIRMSDFNTANYKYGIHFSIPLFLRKERGEYKIARFRTMDASLDLKLENVVIRNKINYQLSEISSFKEQMTLTGSLVEDFKTMLESEERLFFFGESSIFLINSRESNFLSGSLQQLDIILQYCRSHAELYRLMANP